MSYHARFGTPNSMQHPVTPRKKGKRDSEVRVWAKHQLKLCRPHITKFAQARLDDLSKVEDALNNIAVGDWSKSSETQPMRWIVDLDGGVKVCLEMWSD